LLLFYIQPKKTYADLAGYFADKSFGPSFSASLLEDIIVFFVLGLVVAIVSIIVSTKTPETYDYKSRFRALLNSNHAFGNNKFMDFVNKEFEDLLGYNKKLKAIVSIGELISEDENKVYEIYSELQHFIVNAVSDKEYKPFKKPRVRIASDLKVSGKYGYIKALRTFDIKTLKTIKPYVGKGIYEMKDSSYEEDIDLIIPGNNEVGWELNYSVWHNIGTPTAKGWYSISVSRFTQSAELTLFNDKKFDRTLKYDLNLYRYKDNKATPLCETVELKRGGKKTHKLTSVILYPLDRLEIYIYEPK
jgi:hypothetical protein